MDRARQRRLRAVARRARRAARGRRARRGRRLGRRADPLRRPDPTPSTRPVSRSTSSASRASGGSASRRAPSKPNRRGLRCKRRARSLPPRRCSTRSEGSTPPSSPYLEDADLAWRARMAGWRCVLAPRAIALHHHSATLTHGSEAKHLLVGRNRVRMLAKNASRRQLRRRLLRSWLYDLLYVAMPPRALARSAPLAGRLRGLARLARLSRGRTARRRRELEPAAVAGLPRRAATESGLPLAPGRPSPPSLPPRAGLGREAG